ncbi:hypothetical protein [Streptomonospora sp. PA3]|nr:hypothetical protein [Streptomonospora sp. PA3]
MSGTGSEPESAELAALLEAWYGPVPDEAVAEAETAWPDAE